MSDSLEIFMEDICLLPGWILRNLSLMREIDKKSNDIRIKLEEKRNLYLKNLKQMHKCNSSENKDQDLQLMEINELQKEHRILLKEKMAISDQSIHFIRHDGEILRRHYEQLRETLTENFNDGNSTLNNQSGRLSMPSNIHYKNSNLGNNNTNVSNLSTNNSNINRESGSISSFNNNWSIKLHSEDSNNNLLSPKSSINESLNKSTKRRRSSTPATTNEIFEQISTNSKNSNFEISKNEKSKKIDNSEEKNELEPMACSVCKDTELPNNKIISCESCFKFIHINCCWIICPKLCQNCCKKDSIPPKTTYDIEYSSQINTPRSDYTKTKNSRKK